MSQTAKAKPTQRTQWFSSPEPEHIVHFYPLDEELNEALSVYIAMGLLKGETCIVIAKPNTFAGLHKKLRDQGINISAAISKGQYIVYDAQALLSKFMQQGQPNLGDFLTTVGKVVSLAVGRKAPIRAFGEMLAILVEQKNLSGTKQLEKYWNDLMESQVFSLYCAYPEASFKKDNYQYIETFKSICDCHVRTATSPA